MSNCLQSRVIGNLPLQVFRVACLYYFRVQPAHVPRPRLHNLLQGLCPECALASRHHAGYLDRRSLSTVWGSSPLPAQRDIQRQAVSATWPQACALGEALMRRQRVDPTSFDLTHPCPACGYKIPPTKSCASTAPTLGVRSFKRRRCIAPANRK